MKRTASRRALIAYAVLIVALSATTAYAQDPLMEAADNLRSAIQSANNVLALGGRVLKTTVILNLVAGGFSLLTAGIAPLPDSRTKKAVAIATGIVVGFVTIVSNTIFGIDVRSTTNKINTLSNHVASAQELLDKRLSPNVPPDRVVTLLKLFEGSYNPVATATADLQTAINGSFAYFWMRSQTALMITPFAVLEAAQQSPYAQQALGPNLQFVGEGGGATLAEAAANSEADAFKKVGDYLRGELSKRTGRRVPESWLKRYVTTIASVERSQVAPGQPSRVMTTVRISRMSALTGSAEVPSSTLVDVHEYRVNTAKIDATLLCVYVGDVHEAGERTRVVVYQPKANAACPGEAKDISEKEIDRRLVGATVLLDRPMTKGDEVPVREQNFLVAILDLKYRHRAPDQQMTIEIVRVPRSAAR